MGKGKRYIKKSANGRFFLFVEEQEYIIDHSKKTKLWLSSPYLVQESLKDNPEKTSQIIEDLIKWNERNQDFESCSKLLELKRSL
jgi:hypothetical protein